MKTFIITLTTIAVLSMNSAMAYTDNAKNERMAQKFSMIYKTNPKAADHYRMLVNKQRLQTELLKLEEQERLQQHNSIQQDELKDLFKHELKSDLETTLLNSLRFEG